MKRTIFILFALIAFMPTSILLRAQDDLPYRSLKSLNNDTIQYLDYNFTIRNAQYRGKKVSDFIKDLELPIIYVKDLSDIPPEGGMFVVSVTLGIREVYMSDTNKDIFDGDYYVAIAFVEKIPFDDFKKAAKFTNPEFDIPQWTPELQELLKDIEILGIGTNPYLIEERRKILNRDPNPNFNLNEELKKASEKQTKQWQKKNRAKQFNN